MRLSAHEYSRDATQSASERVVHLPFAERSYFGAFMPGEEERALQTVRRLLVDAGLTEKRLTVLYGSVVSDPRRLRRMSDSIRALLDGSDRLSLIPSVVEALCFAGQQRILAEAKLLFPPYDSVRSFAENKSHPVMTSLSSRPAVSGESWRFLSHDIGFPIGVGASPFTDNSRWVKALFGNGFNVQTYRTVRSRPQDAAPLPNWVPVSVRPQSWDAIGKHPVEVYADYADWHEPGDEEISTANFFGMPSPAPKFWQDDLAGILEEVNEGQLLIASVVGETYHNASNEKSLLADFVKTARDAVSVGATVLEINLSSPNALNSDGLASALLCHNWALSGYLIKGLRDALGQDVEIVAKLADMTADNLSKTVAEIGRDVDAISGINAVPAVVKSPTGAEGFKNEVAGLSGSRIHRAAIEFVRGLNRERFVQNFSFEIVASGGVTSPEAFVDLYMSGASVVQAVTGVYSNPLLAYDCIATVGDTLPLSPPEIVGLDSDEVRERVVQLVRASRDANQYYIANELPFSLDTTAQLLDVMTEQGVLQAEPTDRPAGSVHSVRYRATR